jgi:hypothetical protein
MLPKQQARLGNAADTVCQPILWDEILEKPLQKFTPTTVRIYLVDVVARMSKYFGLWMDGPNVGKLRCSRAGKYEGTIDINLSLYCARQLFPKTVSCNWVENGKNKSFRKSVIDLFLMASDRKQIYQASTCATQPLVPVLKWLESQLSIPPEVCPIIFDGLNDRKILYSSFLEGKAHPEDWSPRSISQAFYSSLPGCRPTTGTRIRKRGVAVMYVPSREQCNRVLNVWKQNHLHLRF